jgi:hypothetical protein
MSAPISKKTPSFGVGRSTGGFKSPTDMDSFEGFAAGSSILVPDGKLVRLPNQRCRYAMLSHWNVINNASSFAFRTVSGDQMYENAGDEVYFGFNGVLVAQLFPSQSTGLLPVNNLDQICLRSRPGDDITIWYAWFW